jgi:hypothetical protein
MYSKFPHTAIKLGQITAKDGTRPTTMAIMHFSPAAD